MGSAIIDDSEGEGVGFTASCWRTRCCRVGAIQFVAGVVRIASVAVVVSCGDRLVIIIFVVVVETTPCLLFWRVDTERPFQVTGYSFWEAHNYCDCFVLFEKMAFVFCVCCKKDDVCSVTFFSPFLC